MGSPQQKKTEAFQKKGGHSVSWLGKRELWNRKKNRVKIQNNFPETKGDLNLLAERKIYSVVNMEAEVNELMFDLKEKNSKNMQ